MDKKITSNLVSVIIPAYNCGQYIGETINSVMTQSYSNWECIIVDDGSTDNTYYVAEQYCSRDSRIKLVHQNNQGLPSARNTGIMHSSGEYILPVDGDDIIDQSYIEKAVQHFHSHPETTLVYGLIDYFGSKTGIPGQPRYSYTELIWGNMIVCSAMYRRIHYDKVGGYNPAMRDGYEDWDFWLSLLDANSIVYRIEEVMYHYRVHESVQWGGRWNQIENLNRQIYHNHPDIYTPFQVDIVNMYRKICELKANNDELRKEVEHIRNTRAFRLGKFLLKPLGSLKK